jgi:hypothetical protein
VTLLVTLALAATLTFAPAVSAHEDNEAEEASSEHFLRVNWYAPWMSRALVIGGLAVVGVGIYATQRRYTPPNPSVGIARMKASGVRHQQIPET